MYTKCFLHCHALVDDEILSFHHPGIKLAHDLMLSLQLREYAVQLKELVDKKCSEEEMKQAKKKMMTEVKKVISVLS